MKPSTQLRPHLRLLQGLALLCLSGLAAADTGAPGAEAAANDRPLTLSAEGNTLLPESALRAVLQPIAPPLSIEKIRQRAEQLQAAYRDAGYATVVVLVPEQTVQDQTLHLQVVEGRVDQIYVQGNRRFSQDNIRRSLPGLVQGQTPNLVDIDTNTQQANENPAKSTRVVFQPSNSAGKIDALVVTRERDPVQYSVGVDNTGTASTGHYRSSLSYLNSNLFGRDQQLGLRGELSPNLDAHSNALSLSYLLPWYAAHSAFELTASYSNVDSRAIATPAGDALFSGRGDTLGLRYRWYLPKRSEWRQKLSVGIDQRRYRNECRVGSLGSAGCGAANADIGVRPVLLAYDVQLGTLLSGNLQLVHNLFSGGTDGSQASFDAVRVGAPAHYSLLRGTLGLQKNLDANDSLSWRLQFQYTANALVPGEQFGAGGLRTVRGYEERELVADSGVFGSVEWTHALLRSGSGDSALSGAGFADASLLANQRGSPCRQSDSVCRIGSAGLGLRLQYRQQLQARLDLARAFADAQRTESGDFRLHFSLVYGF